ncbi:MAG: AAA family ATPase [Caldilineaceae bacterium]
MILVITGPSGAGKSTLAAAWVKAQQRDIALIDPDQITAWMRNGDQSAVRLAHTQGPVARIAQHYRITGQIYAAAAQVYAANGIDVVISQLIGFDPPPPWSKGWDRLDALEPIFVVLLPTRDVCRERRIARGSSPDDGSYDFNWHAWQAHPRARFLENSELSVDASVAALDGLLAEFVGGDTK